MVFLLDFYQILFIFIALSTYQPDGICLYMTSGSITYNIMQTIQKLSARHYGILEKCLRGWVPKDIAEHYNMSQQQVSIVINSPSFQYQLADRRSKLNDRQDQDIVEQTQKVDEAIAGHTMAAVSRLGLVVTDGKDGDAIRAADSILDRSGHPRVQKTESKSVSVTIDAEDAKLIAETMGMDR